MSATKRQLLVTEEQMDELLERAAKAGAKQALKELGLGDENAGNDIRDIRSILDGFREARKTVFLAFLKWGTAAILTFIVAWTGFNYGAK